MQHKYVAIWYLISAPEGAYKEKMRKDEEFLDLLQDDQPALFLGGNEEQLELNDLQPGPTELRHTLVLKETAASPQPLPRQALVRLSE